MEKIYRGMASGAETIDNNFKEIDFQLSSNGNVVHKTGDESIAGKKTFTGDVEVNGSLGFGKSKMITQNVGYGRTMTFVRKGNLVTVTSSDSYGVVPRVGSWITDITETIPLGFRPVVTANVRSTYLGAKQQGTWNEFSNNGTIRLYNDAVLTTTDYYLTQAQSWLTNDPFPT